MVCVWSFGGMDAGERSSFLWDIFGAELVTPHMGSCLELRNLKRCIEEVCVPAFGLSHVLLPCRGGIPVQTRSQRGATGRRWRSMLHPSTFVSLSCTPPPPTVHDV